MSTFSGSPRLLKGAIIGVDPFNPLASVVVSQYNPNSITRRLEPRAVSSKEDRGDDFNHTGSQKEAISFSIKIDASDQIERANSVTTTVGNCPKLAGPFSKDCHLLFKNTNNQHPHQPEITL